MQAKTLLPDVQHLRCDRIRWDGLHVVVRVSSAATTAVCPKCGQPSGRIHSHYLRQLEDLPWLGIAVREKWSSRRFFCDNAGCPQRIFTERLPDVAAPYARKTRRLAATLQVLAFACGGEGGARLARQLEIQSSPDTLLRQIRRSVNETHDSVRVLGVDEWAVRRGQRYGTILVDLEAHRTIDLLPDRSSESFAAWLSQHPEVEVIARDRGEHYGQGANLGAPQAAQVADRWHLLQNDREALTRLLERFPKELRQAAATPPPPAELAAQVSAAEPVICPLQAPEPQVPLRQPRWQEKYKQVVELHGQKQSARAIARELELDRGTVRRWLKAGCLPERVAGRRRGSRVEAWRDYLAARWQAGCHNAVVLAKELREQGFTGSYYPVRRFISQWRSQEATGSIATVPAWRVWMACLARVTLGATRCAVVVRLLSPNRHPPAKSRPASLDVDVFLGILRNSAD